VAVDEIVARGAVEVEIAGRRVPAALRARPFYDPEGRRLRGS
jgi:glycine cleavage system aminomethyltransferase T